MKAKYDQQEILKNRIRKEELMRDRMRETNPNNSIQTLQTL